MRRSAPECPTCGFPSSKFAVRRLKLTNGRGLYECKCSTGALLPPPVVSNDDFSPYTDEDYMTGLSHEAHSGWLDAALSQLPEDVQSSLSTLRVLDFGAGQGIWHELLAQRGCNVTSYEPNRSLAEKGSSRGLKMHSELAEMAGSEFDLIVANSVLEHVFDPFQLVRDEIIPLLSAKGIFLACVPNYGSWNRKLLRSRWMGWSPEEHIWFWTPEAAEVFIRRTKDLNLCSVTVYAAAGRPIDRWKPRHPLKRIYYCTVQRVFERIGKGDQLIIVAQCR